MNKHKRLNRPMLFRHRSAVSLLSFTLMLAMETTESRGQSLSDAELLQAGAAIVDVTPSQWPVYVNGGFAAKRVDQVKTRVNARTIVLRCGSEQIGLVVVDSCMLPRWLLDDIKQRASQKTNLKPDHIMISATHTHSAPSAFAALGTPADQTYIPLLRERIVESLVAAEANLEPARVGWGSADAAEFTALRRWILRPDRVRDDPFGNPTVRATMHSARNLDEVVGPSGPEDPELSMIAFESLEGKPIAVLANFSMHYFGDQPISADYFGLFCNGLEERLNPNQVGPPSTSTENDRQVVAILSHGCSGDIWRRDYATWQGKDSATIDSYTQGLLGIAGKLYESIEFAPVSDLAMTEARLPMRYRIPDRQRLEWAKRIVEGLGDELPKSQTDVYALEQTLLHELKSTTVVVQAMRIGNIGIATTPNETYALTGLKIKARSPLPKTMVIELANGADGYIPPPEQHHFGGYNTWAARSAGLEIQAEPRIVQAAVTLLERATGKRRRSFHQSVGPAAKQIFDQAPIAYWRLDEMEAPAAIDSSGNHRDGVYEQGVAYFLEGPQSHGFTDGGDVNRCAHFSGGRMCARLPDTGEDYTVTLSLWNGMPNDARETTGWLFSRDFADAISDRGEHLGIGGTATSPGRIIFQSGDATPVVGKTVLKRWNWHQVKLVRSGDRIRVYVDQSEEPEIDVQAPAISDATTCFIGGRSDNESNFEGRIDEVAIFDEAF